MSTDCLKWTIDRGRHLDKLIKVSVANNRTCASRFQKRYRKKGTEWNTFAK